MVRKYVIADCAVIAKAIAGAKDDYIFRRRLMVIQGLLQNYTLHEVGKINGYNQRSVGKILKLFNEKGVDGLRSGYKGGNNRKLTFSDEAAYLKQAEAEACKGLYPRVAELQAAVEKLSGVKYSQKTFYALLARHKWKKLMPRGRHPKKASEVEIETSKKLT
jgi:transposase